MAYITPALLYIILNVIAAAGVLPWVLRRKKAGKALRINGSTNLSAQPARLPALAVVCYVMVFVLALIIGGAALYGVAVALGGDMARELVVACELAVAGAALGIWSSYCCLQMTKDNPDYERLSRSSGG